MLLKRFNIVADVWDGMPWWQQRMYLEQMNEEITEQESILPQGDPDDQLRALGVQIS